MQKNSTINKYLTTILYAIFIAINTQACKENRSSLDSEEKISSTIQDSVFNKLMTLTNNTISDKYKADSLAFLILPIDASCPSCRRKTIDSIAKYQTSLNMNHYIIISANAGIKIIDSYFKEQGQKTPIPTSNILLDTLNFSFKNDLCHNKPTIYYTYNKKAYKKVASIPATIRKDLDVFFSW